MLRDYYRPASLNRDASNDYIEKIKYRAIEDDFGGMWKWLINGEEHPKKKMS